MTGASTSTPEFHPPRKVNPVPAGWPTRAGARDELGFVAEVPLEDGLRRPRLAGRRESTRRADRADEPCRMTTRPHDPDRQAHLGEEEAAAAREAILSGWVTQGPEVAAFEHEFAAYVGAPHACAVSNCTTALHLALLAPGRRPGRRGHHRQPLVHRHRQRHPLLRRDAGVRRHRPGHLQHRSGADRGGDHPADQGHPAASTSSGMPCDLARIARRSAAGMRIPVIEDAACAIGSEILLERALGARSAARTATSPASRSTRAR